MVCGEHSDSGRPSVGPGAVGGLRLGTASRDGAGFGENVDVDDLVGERDRDWRTGVFVLGVP
jgi:hypothetical protein